MKDKKFEDAVRKVAADDARFHPDAYFLLQEALRYTVEEIGSEEGEGRHVSADELLDGFRRYSLNEFGPMAVAVLEDWGVTQTGDVGAMVFNLIDSGIFAGSEDDRLEDFQDVFPFNEAFEEPFRPAASKGKDTPSAEGETSRHPQSDPTNKA